ncbi:phage holin family protein [Roseateles violae]|uniref:Phage holin family protein n=1 Tax=Roseateles violae TaxID=3058042 RepID=A0ABT8DWG8_9BURK|nr:phage holin family protein [Pelomonas sp. PFR6]MDN3922582.1 phage holin family protein [Pelomonas sp. PFR6]
MSSERPEATIGAPPDGVLATLRRIATQALELLQTRLELLSTELEAEKLRLLAALTQGLVAVLLGIAAIAMLSIALLLLAPERLRWLAALALGLLYLAGAAWCWLRTRALLSQGGGLFAASAAELQRDREALER